MAEKIIQARLLKADTEHGLIFGWGIICTKGGEPFYDSQGDYISPDAMIGMTARFMKNSRVMDIGHSGILSGTAPNDHGAVTHSMPMTHEIAAAFGMTTETEGWMIAAAPDDPKIMDLAKQGKVSGFSIGGTYRSRKKIP